MPPVLLASRPGLYLDGTVINARCGKCLEFFADISFPLKSSMRLELFNERSSLLSPRI